MGERTERWQVGDVTITSVVEVQFDGVPPELFFAGSDAAMVQQHGWLQPHYADERGMLHFRIQALVLEVAGRTIVVDPCIGNGKKRELPFWNEQQWPFVERLEGDAGVALDRVDQVVHTHLHLDHVGWDSRMVDGAWVPTFPNARYLYVGDDLDELLAMSDDESRQIVADSIRPVLDAGLADRVAADHDLGDGLRLVSTPGHTAAHASLLVESAGERALVTGDAVHHPLQLAEPALSFGDADLALASRTRHELLRSSAGDQRLVFGTHFPSHPMGRVVADGPGWRFEPEPGEAA
jgi:glyoxylase-like metal-dependent hydrolase (beta-lactamase superfamily II)